MWFYYYCNQLNILEKRVKRVKHCVMHLIKLTFDWKALLIMLFFFVGSIILNYKKRNYKKLKYRRRDIGIPIGVPWTRWSRRGVKTNENGEHDVFDNSHIWVSSSIMSLSVSAATFLSFLGLEKQGKITTLSLRVVNSEIIFYMYSVWGFDSVCKEL